LSSVEGADSESVGELIEEGNAFEADVVTGVEDAGNAESSFPVNFPSTSASTSFASRCTGPRAFVRFKVGSLRCEDLLCFFKVDLLFHVIAR
jgi:hypothetical protein